MLRCSLTRSEKTQYCTRLVKYTGNSEGVQDEYVGNTAGLGFSLFGLLRPTLSIQSNLEGRTCILSTRHAEERQLQFGKLHIF